MNIEGKFFHDGYDSDAEEELRTIKVELSREEIKYMLDNEIIDKLGK